MQEARGRRTESGGGGDPEAAIVIEAQMGWGA